MLRHERQKDSPRADLIANQLPSQTVYTTCRPTKMFLGSRRAQTCRTRSRDGRARRRGADGICAESGGREDDEAAGSSYRCKPEASEAGRDFRVEGNRARG